MQVDVSLILLNVYLMHLQWPDYIMQVQGMQLFDAVQGHVASVPAESCLAIFVLFSPATI